MLGGVMDAPLAGSTSARELPMVTMVKEKLATRPVRLRNQGDSIIAGASSGGVDIGGLGSLMCYALEGAACNFYYPNDTTKTLPQEGYGVAGQTVNGLMNASNRYDSMTGQADVMVLQLGANDMSASGSQLTASNMAKLGRNWFDLAQQAMDTGKAVIGVKIYKTSTKDATDVATFNAMIEAGCAARGIPYWTGLYDVVQGNTGTYCTDGIHLNALGTELVVANWKAWWRGMFGAVQTGSWVGSSTSPQLAVVGNAVGKQTSFGDYGYGTPTGTYSSATWPVAGNMKEAGWSWTKTGGESLMAAFFSLGSLTAGRYYRFVQRIKTAGMRAGGSYLLNKLVINGAGVARFLLTSQADLVDECVVDYVFKAPAASTTLDVQVAMRSVGGTGVSSTGQLWISDMSLRDMTASGMATEWGLS